MTEFVGSLVKVKGPQLLSDRNFYEGYTTPLN
jgi:hypothetical protein